MMHIRKILLLSIMSLLWIVSCYGQDKDSYGQHLGKPDIILSKHKILKPDSLVYAKAEIASDTGYIEVQLFNLSVDTVYLFTSYFGENLYQSSALHRYNIETNECILSFLPIPFFLGNRGRADRILIGQIRVVNPNQILYEFESIYPNSYISLLIPKNCFNFEYVEDYEPKEYGKYRGKMPDFKQINYIPDCSLHKIEFAIYMNLDWFNEDTYNFEKGTIYYEVISVVIDDLF